MKQPYFLKCLLSLIFIGISGLYAQVPVANFGPSKTIVIEQYNSVQFFDSSTNSPFQWVWDVYDSSNSSGFYPNLSSGMVYSDPWGNGDDEYSKNPVFAFDVPGKYTVSLKCANLSGWSTTFRRQMIVHVIKPISYYLGYGTFGENNDNVVEWDSGYIFDDGGPNLRYGNNHGKATRAFLHIKPCRAKEIILTMSQLKFADTNDILSVYDGPDDNPNNLIVAWTKNNTSNKVATAYSGEMYILFKSNSTLNDSGYNGRYDVVKDTASYTLNTAFDSDSIFYKGVPGKFINKSTGFSGIQQSKWFVDGSVAAKQTNVYNKVFNQFGNHQVCLSMSSCNDFDSICKTIQVDTPNSKTNLNFSYKSFARYAYDSVHLIPQTDKANRFIWKITPTSYLLYNPPAYPSYYQPGLIAYKATPGDSIPIPKISFLDTVCYTITLMAYNDYDSTNTVDTFRKYNYICAGDFRNVYGIFGKVYHDNNSDCQLNNSEIGLENIKLNLYDSNNQLIASTYTYKNGLYRFDRTSGTYTVALKTDTGKIKTFCSAGYDSTVSISSQNKINGINFGVKCASTGNPDIGVNYVATNGIVFPGRKHILKINGGQLNNYSGMNCASSNVSGSVVVTVTDKVTYAGVPNQALTPSSISGKTFTYNISNFNNLDKDHALQLILLVDTNIVGTNFINVNVKFNPTSGDPDTSNNSYIHSYRIFNSYDPNMKEVSPENVDLNYNGWFTYTIHFQNTGDAPAFNIRLDDTLDAQLDLETFQMLGSSHPTRVSLKGNFLRFYFDDIMLPDSFSDEPGSKGFVQYRLKAHPGTQKGDVIKNTAYIYFDYNAPVVTNTTTNEYVEENNSIVSPNNNWINIYPNPSTGLYHLNTPADAHFSISVCDLTGKVMYEKNDTTSNAIDLSQCADGVYIVTIVIDDQLMHFKVLKSTR